MEVWGATLLYILAGALTGLMSGILGIGGGIIVVPALLFIFDINGIVSADLAMHMAAGTSLAVILFTSFASVQAHNKIEPLLWGVYRNLWPGIVLGTISGAILASMLSTKVLRIMFALFLLFIAYKMIMSAKRDGEGQFPSTWINRLVSFLIGLKSGLLGVGGGVLIIPYLTYCGVDPRRIAGVSSLCTMTIASIGTLTFMVLSQSMVRPDYSTGYVYWPAVFWVAIFSMIAAPFGAKLSYVIPVKGLRYLFVCVLLITVLGLLI